ncbi:phosphotransferase [Paenibacillus sp. P96]|uniref:Phosphotransferase n=1 Tax=Paenibacillus zeirhizosphaerae TaxID=2987519 RepID=A0ABT9FR46_9BACL|nr:phosphotransferase [Paenibacillus sp. P96]MDP4097183.1 phosphotransferase [Paenibacillus sp. P96]
MNDNLIKRYWPFYAGQMEKRAGGWNNTTYFVCGDRGKGVLRIYETHKEQEKIRFEHFVLEQLQRQPLRFKVPVPVQTLAGDTIVQLEDGSGKLACLFEYIEGTHAPNDTLTFARSFGEAAAELSAALASMQLEMPPVYPSYYELGQSYPLCDVETVSRFCAYPAAAFMDLREELLALCTEYGTILHSLDRLRKLPHQLVHGDLNASNLLLDRNDPHKVTALLDFEFCTWDVRVMEAAVILSGLLGHEQEREAVRQFCAGYAGQIRLYPEEIHVIPVLIRLRKIDVFLHFMSRYLNGTDGPEVLHQQVRLLASDLKRLDLGVTWLEQELSCLASSQ